MKNLKNLGTVLSSIEQKRINGGYDPKYHPCTDDDECGVRQSCYNGYCES